MKRIAIALALLAAFIMADASSQQARLRWEAQNQVRRDKFDLILPQAMRENRIDMWIIVMKDGHVDPLYALLGEGFVNSTGYIIFSDRGGERIERAALGIEGAEIENCGAYDIFASPADLKKFVIERDPQRIGLNMSDDLGMADGLSKTAYERLVATLGQPYAARLVPAEKLVSDFLYRRTASEIVVFGQAGHISKEIAERALSSEVIVPGVTTLADVAWWVRERLEERGLGSSFGFPSVYITGPGGIEAISNDRVIQRGELLMIDWGVGLMGLWTDMKRIAYVLRAGEARVPAGLQNAFDRALGARQVVLRSIRPGRSGRETLAAIHRNLEQAGFAVMKAFNQPSATTRTEVITGCHSVGSSGHGIGPSAAFFQERQLEFTIVPTTLLTLELFAYTAAPEWGGRKVRIPLEDDIIVTERGAEWLYPTGDRILLIR